MILFQHQKTGNGPAEVFSGTGITRGRKLVILVGQEKIAGMAVKGKVETRRWSKLAEWMA